MPMPGVALAIGVILVDAIMAGVAKWLRQWIVIPPFVGSSPIIRPVFRDQQNKLARPLARFCQ
jgi:hypothetical protein